MDFGSCRPKLAAPKSSVPVQQLNWLLNLDIPMLGRFLLADAPPKLIYSHFQLTGSDMDLVDEWWPYGEWHEPAYALDPSSPKLRLVQTEHRRVVSAATSLSMDYTASPSTSRSVPEKEWTIDGVASSKIQIGCCDMLNPSFTSLRLAVVLDKTTGIAAPFQRREDVTSPVSSTFEHAKQITCFANLVHLRGRKL